MKMLPSFLIVLILTAWVSSIAILSVQNATLVSLKFLSFQSIEIPVGVILAFSVGIGLISGIILPTLVSPKSY